jgi:hypothetical protein
LQRLHPWPGTRRSKFALSRAKAGIPRKAASRLRCSAFTLGRVHVAANSPFHDMQNKVIHNLTQTTPFNTVAANSSYSRSKFTYRRSKFTFTVAANSPHQEKPLYNQRITGSTNNC